jgi:hypothetical protein
VSEGTITLELCREPDGEDRYRRIAMTKMTRHFVGAAHKMTPGERLTFANILLDGSLVRAVEDHPGTNVAVSLDGGCYIVACRDAHDPGMMALLTCLAPDRCDCLHSRRDTRIVSLRRR